MQKIYLDDNSLKKYITADILTSYTASIALAEEMLKKRNGLGNDFLGWLDLPKKIDKDIVKKIKAKASEIKQDTDIFICIGIGGSYLGARAAIEFLCPTFEDTRKPRVIFAGHQVNSDYLSDLLKLIENKKVTLNIISKSGTTTEPGITFRVLRKWMEDTYGKAEAAKRIIATTDPAKGALRALAKQEGYDTFAIPADVGGRFSVLTPVGLLPIAVAGIDIEELIAGAREAMDYCSSTDLSKNIAARYAINRNILFQKGKNIEVLASFQPQIHFVSEWWKQLFGESEGKDNTGIFPASVDYTTDLHSLGQYMQEGTRSVFETFVLLKKTSSTVTIPRFQDDGDELNFLADESFETVNFNAYKGTLLAHYDGDVPVSTINVEERSAQALGQLFYFFEKATALSGYLLRVNPFNQPGVETYKKNMFALLSKPGFEKQGASIKQRLTDLGL